MNSLNITWAIVKASKGQATKRDLSIIVKKADREMAGCLMSIGGENVIAIYFPNREKAQTAFGKVNGLFKKYEVTLITDKQFGLIDTTKDVMEVATSKQKAEAFILK